MGVPEKKRDRKGQGDYVKKYCPKFHKCDEIHESKNPRSSMNLVGKTKLKRLTLRHIIIKIEV